MTSTSESTKHSPVETAAVVAHGRIDVRAAVERVRAVAERAGVELVEEPDRAQLAVAVGGDGTILRTLARLLGTGIPVIGINFGRVGFLASIAPERLEDDLVRVFAGEYRTIEQPTLEAQLDGGTLVAVNDVVATSSTLGRMIELGWSIADEDLGEQRKAGPLRRILRNARSLPRPHVPQPLHSRLPQAPQYRIERSVSLSNSCALVISATSVASSPISGR
jgi:NAD kinase